MNVSDMLKALSIDSKDELLNLLNELKQEFVEDAEKHHREDLMRSLDLHTVEDVNTVLLELETDFSMSQVRNVVLFHFNDVLTTCTSFNIVFTSF